MALKNAFLFRTTYLEACTCKPHPWEREALDRHRFYAERAQKSKQAIAAKVQPTKRASAQVREATDKRGNLGPQPIDAAAAAQPQAVAEGVPAAPAPAVPAADVAEVPTRPEGAMLLGAQEPAPPTKRASRKRSVEKAPPRERRQISSERSSSGRPEWASRVFGGSY